MFRRAFIFQGQNIRKYKPTHNDCNGIILIINRKHASSWMWQGPKPKLGEVQPQKFKHLLVIDFEATCGAKGSEPKPQEIIEFPCALLNTNKGFEIEAIFHEYVRPVHNPMLTRFCTELTGITQDMVDTEDDFATVFNKFNNWLVDQGMIACNKDNLDEENTNFTFVTCGDWDLKYMLPNQCDTSNIQMPRYFRKWINVKRTYATSAGGNFPRSLQVLLSKLNLTFEGRQHSGIDDVKNIAKIVKVLAKERFVVFENTN